jgi:hypothetical protein
MDLAVIIVNWNTRNFLDRCLRSIKENVAGLRIETIVVDNNSGDGSREMAAERHPWARLINSGANVGFARGCNVGLRVATAPLVLFLNPDTEILPMAFERMVEYMRANPEVGALGCKIRDPSGRIKQLGLQWFPSPLTEMLKVVAVSRSTYRRLPRFFPYHDPEVSGEVKKLFGACLLVRRSVLEQVGSFDERFFMYCEDVDLCQRIAAAGWRLYYLSEAEILHLGGAASAKAPSAFAVLMMCESFSKLMRKHHGRSGSVAYRVVALFGAQLRLLSLLGLRLAGLVGLGASVPDFRGSTRKYVAITKWTLGLEKALVRD